jgi:hypothetical protein
VNLKELRTALQDRREDYSASDAKLNRKVNQAYLDICSRRKWGWLRREFTTDIRNSILVTGVDPAVSANSRITVNNGERFIFIESAVAPTGREAGWNRTILFDSTFYKVVHTTNAGGAITLWLDREYTGPTYPNTAVTPTDYGTLTFLSDEVALPLGTKTLIESVLFKGTTAYPLSLSHVSPYLMARNDKNTTGQPTSASVIEKEPIPRPRKAISDFGALTANTGAALVQGATYTYWYTYVDIVTGAESSLSPPSTITLSSIQGTVTFPTITARYEFGLRIYRSVADGLTPFVITSLDSGSANLGGTDSTPDDLLGRSGSDSASSMFVSLHPAAGTLASTHSGAHTTAYQLHCLYEAEATAMDNDYDRPLFDASFSPVLLDGAEYLMLTSSDEQSRAQSARRGYEAGIQRMISQDRLNFQQRVLIGRSGRRLRGQRTWWYGALGT